MTAPVSVKVPYQKYYRVLRNLWERDLVVTKTVITKLSLCLCCVPELLISDVILYSLRIRRSAGSCVYGRNMLFLPACVHLLSLPEYGIISAGRKVLFWFICFCFERCPCSGGVSPFFFSGYIPGIQQGSVPLL